MHSKRATVPIEVSVSAARLYAAHKRAADEEHFNRTPINESRSRMATPWQQHKLGDKQLCKQQGEFTFF